MRGVKLTKQDITGPFYVLVTRGNGAICGEKTMKWPTFKPHDPNVVCRICTESWYFHGTKEYHCPPCNRYLPKIADRCNKVLHHKGKCALVTAKGKKSLVHKDVKSG